MNFIRLSPAAEAAIGRLEAGGFEAWAVGGCVRDSLLGRIPNDWDLTTNARPEEVLACFPDCRTVETGLRHGTVTVLLCGDALEITTYRRDGAYADNRHPVQVTFSDTVEDDLARRDFTVNAMAYHPVRGLCDPYGGRADLDARVIRCVGDPSTRFHEDGLRILRAVRFAAVLGFSVDPATAGAVRDCRSLLDNIARERVRAEFDKLLTGQACAGILRAFPEIAAQIVPEILPAFGFPQNSRYHCYDVWEHTLAALSYAEPDRIVRLALFFHDIGKPATYREDARGGHFPDHARVSVSLAAAAMERLRYDRDTAARVLELVRIHDLPLPTQKKGVRRLMMQLPAEDIGRLLEIQRCDRLAHHPDYRTMPPEWYALPRMTEEIRAEGDCLSLRSLAVSGNDLMALGIPSGPLLGELLRRLLDAVVDGALPNSRDALLHAAEALWNNGKKPDTAAPRTERRDP